MPIHIEDAFAVGIGFDFAGAVLLGRGLLASPLTILDRATPKYGFHVGQAVGQAEDRVDAEAGIVSLVIGFVIQAVAYAVVMAYTPRPTHGVGAVLAFPLAMATAVAVLLVWDHVLRRRRLWRLLVEMARYDRARQRHDLPSASRLQDFGMELGFPGTAEEVTFGGPPIYARRVFGVDDTRTDHDVFPSPMNP